MTLTLEILNTTLAERFGGTLKSGCHEDQCEVCVRELRAAVLDLPWSDHPDGDNASPTDIVAQRLNDVGWSSDEARTRYCLPLALLSEATAAPGWRDAYILQTIRVSVAGALRAAASVHPDPSHQKALQGHAEKLAQVDAAAAARAAAYAAAAARAAAYAAAAARAAAYAAADAAAYAAAAAADAAAVAAADAARYATYAAPARDKALIEAVGIFIAAQQNPEAQSAWDALMAEDAQQAEAKKEVK